MSITLTGSGGFLGFHTRGLAHSLGKDVNSLVLGDAFCAERAASEVNGSSRLIHVAGVNRGTDEEVHAGNILMAEQVASVLRAVEAPPEDVVFANSIQAGNGSVYGSAKAEASEIIGAAAREVGATFVDVKLPNLFGEHGKPFYNSVVATFCHLLQSGQSPEVKEDKELLLLHAQDAAAVLLGEMPSPRLEGAATQRRVSDVLAQLAEIAHLYKNGDIPPLMTDFDLDLFNTYRSFRVGGDLPFSLDRRADQRGSFFEVCRSHGGDGQTSFSTTAPSVIRGQHFHRRKVERFVVLSGKAEISMRKLFTNDVLTFAVDGDAPVAIDMPTMWTHNITNTGNSDLYTMFWTNDIFDPLNPDTFAENV